MMADTVDVRVERLVYGGDAIGKLLDGRKVFVPFAFPGELVRLRLVEGKRGYMRGELVEVLEPAEGRIIPRCIHFGYCGGCHYQHMSYAAQVEAKAAILREQLERLGGFRELPQVELLVAPNPWYYRNNLQFHLARDGKLGFQKAHSNQTFAIRECHLPEPVINQVWPQLDIAPLPGLERVSLRAGAGEELVLILESTNTTALDFEIENLTISVVHETSTGSIVLAGSDHVIMEVAGRPFRVTGTAFFQVNTRQANAMVKYLTDNLVLDEGMTVIDVYCGVGLFSSFIAPKVKTLVGIELSPQACADFAFNLDEFDNVSLYEAAAEDVLTGVSFHPDLIIVDPPREGLGSKVVQGILSQGAGRLAYVSCDPATLARDARRLIAEGYRLDKFALVDMFPQTYHIESISLWSKSS